MSILDSVEMYQKPPEGTKERKDLDEAALALANLIMAACMPEFREFSKTTEGDIWKT